jgi:hypothetical protein
VSDESEAVEEVWEQVESALSPPELDARPLGDLPRHDEVWQVDSRQLRAWINFEGDLRRPWVVLVFCPTTGLVLNQRLDREQPAPDVVWGVLEEAMRSARYGEPHRPARLEVASGDALVGIADPLEAIGVDCGLAGDLREFEQVAADLGRRFDERDVCPALTSIRGAGPAAVERLFGAAYDFYRRAPWQQVAGDRFIRIELGEPARTWFACVMGQSGMVHGVALYDDPQQIERILRGRTPDQRVEELSAISMSYGEEFELPFDDLDAAERFAWPVAAPEAWPSAYRVRPGMQIEPLTADELATLEACLRLIPGFIACGRKQEEAAAMTSGGAMTATLSWMN